MEQQCIQLIAQAIQNGQIDPQMPIGVLVQQAMGGAQQPEQGLGGSVVAQPGM